MRRLSSTLVLASIVGLTACRTVQTGPTETASTQPQPAPAIPAGTRTLPEGTPLQVQLQDTLSTEQSQVGDEVRATLTSPIVDEAGKTLVPAGAVVAGAVTELEPSTREDKPAIVRVDFTRLEVDGTERPVAAEVTEANPKLDRDYSRAGKGAAIGGLGGLAVGAIIGRSVTGAVIGGVLGAATGTAISLGTGDVPASLPAGTPMTLRLTEPAPIR